MRRTYSTLGAVMATVLVGMCLGQQLEFDAASVKAISPAEFGLSVPAGGPGSSGPGRYSARVWLIDLLKTAYGIPDDQISGGPAWLRATSGSSLYQVDATMPPDTTKQRFQAMLQNLLVQRFHLAVHREIQNFPAFDLVVAKSGPKLKEAAADSAAISGSPAADSGPPRTDRDGFPVLPPGPHTGQIASGGNLRCKFQQRPMAYFTAVLGLMITRALGPPPGVRSPRVIDKTGLMGTYDFTLEFACGGCVAASAAGASSGAADGTAVGGDGPSIFVALEKQLGLKVVKAQDIPLEVIVVDHVDKAPTAN